MQLHWRLPSVALTSLVLLASSGCVSVPSVVSLALERATPSGPVNVPKTPLASSEPERLAKVCLTTAKQLAARGQDAAAIEQFEKAVQFDDNIDVTHELAVLYGRVGNTRRATQLFDAAIADTPRDSQLLSDYGYFLYSAGRAAEAEEVLRESLAIAKTQTTQANLACVLVALGRHDEACQLFGEAGPQAEAELSVALLAAHRGDGQAAAAFAERAATNPMAAANASSIARQIAERQSPLSVR